MLRLRLFFPPDRNAKVDRSNLLGGIGCRGERRFTVEVEYLIA